MNIETPSCVKQNEATQINYERKYSAIFSNHGISIKTLRLYQIKHQLLQ